MFLKNERASYFRCQQVNPYIIGLFRRKRTGTKIAHKTKASTTNMSTSKALFGKLYHNGSFNNMGKATDMFQRIDSLNQT